MNNLIQKIPHPVVVLLALLTPSLCTAYEIGFNSGSEVAYTTKEGRAYQSDQPYTLANGAGYVDGYIGKSPGEVKSGGTRNYDLYLQDRRGLSEYRFDVPDGSYIVKLHFSEIEHLWRKLRVFDIWIENERVLKDFDIFNEVRRNYTIDYQFATQVNDGQLNVRFTATHGEPSLSAVYVFSRAPDLVAPREPRHFLVAGGYGQAILDWTDNREDDIGGYDIYRSENGEFHLLDQSPSSSYIDRAVNPHEIYQYAVSAVDLFGNRGARVEFRPVIILARSDSALPVYDLYTDESHLIYLSQHIWDDMTIPVVLRHEGVEYRGVRMRHRGGAARRQALKSSIKLIFDDNQLFQGKKKLNLQSDTWDSSLMRSKFAFDDYRRAGALAPAAEWVHLRLNDEFMGVYTAVDQIDERFLSINGRDPTGNIYKPFDFLVVLPNAEDYLQYAEKETNRGQIDGDLKEFVELVNLTPQHLIREKLWEVLDINGYLNWYCVNQLISNWDIAGHNFYLYHDLNRKKWEVIAWDPDVSYVQEDMPLDQGTRNSPMYDVPYWWDRLIDRVLNVPQFRRMYCLRLLELLDTTFSDTERISRVETGHQGIRFDGERDTKKPGWLENEIWFYPSLWWIKDFSTKRNVFLRDSIPDFIPPPSVNLFINEIAPEGWIEIYNWSPKESVDLRGLFLSEDANEPTKTPLPSGHIPPGGHIIVESPQVNGGGGFIGLFEREDGGSARLVDQITYPALGDNLTGQVTYGRLTDGSGELDILTSPTPGGTNRWLAPVVFDASAKVDFSTQKLTKGDQLEQTVYLQNQMNIPQTVQLWSKLSVAGEPAYPGAFTQPQEIQLHPLEHLTYQLTRVLPENLPPGVSYEYVVEIGNTEEGNERIWDSLQIQMSLFSSSLVGHLHINELMAANRQTVADEHGEYDDWVEIYNSSDSTIHLDGLYLSDDMREPTKWQIRGIEISPMGYQLFWLDGNLAQGTGHAGFNLSASGEGIGIFDTDENGNAIIDWIAFGIQAEDVSLGRYPDGGDNLESCASATPGESNIRVENSVTFNELMVNNRSTLGDEAGEYDSWIEIYNSGCHVVNLAGLYLSDTASTPIRWKFPSVEVPPGGFVIVWADGEENQGELHTNFKLSSNGGSILLFDRDANFNTPLDAFRFGKQTADVSLGRHPNGNGPWDILRTPTPGAINIRPQLYVNEIMTRNRGTIADESGQYDDWIELYNATDKPIRLDGLFLSDDLADPTKWRLPAVTIAADGFILIWADRDENAGKLHANFSLSANPESVGLFASSDAGVKLIDSLEFPLMDVDVSYGRIPDGGRTLEMLNKPTPGLPNVSDSETPAGPIRLMQNYPNPHATETLIPFRLSKPSELALTIYNLRGQKVRHIDLGFRETGSYVDFQRAIRWDGRNEQGELAASGVYFYTLASENHRATRKLTVLR
jgi:hypothetical protein